MENWLNSSRVYRAFSLSIITLKFKSIELENKKIEYFP